MKKKRNDTNKSSGSNIKQKNFNIWIVIFIILALILFTSILLYVILNYDFFGEGNKNNVLNIDNKYYVDSKFCKTNDDCIFREDICAPANKYYVFNDLDTNRLACNLAQCGAICANGQCRTDYSCL